MSRFCDRQTVYIATPEYGDDYGNKKIIGYKNLRKLDLMYVPATSDSDITIYGDNVSRIIKFTSSVPVDVNANGRDGIFLSEPTLGEDGYYHDPDYISKPVSHFGKVWNFDAEKN